LSDVRDVGVPDEPSGLYTDVAAPGWRLYDHHLLEVNFFESLDENLPRFTADHIETTARELLLADPLSSSLDDVGFDESEKTALLLDVANNDERPRPLGPVEPDSGRRRVRDGNRPAAPPAAMGALLWIRGLDRHLWQNEVMITDEIPDDAVRYVKAMLGGLFVTATAACDLAGDGQFTDEQLTAALTAGSAVQIVSQEELLHSVFYIRDDMRAPSELR